MSAPFDLPLCSPAEVSGRCHAGAAFVCVFGDTPTALTLFSEAIASGLRSAGVNYSNLAGLSGSGFLLCVATDVADRLAAARAIQKTIERFGPTVLNQTTVAYFDEDEDCWRTVYWPPCCPGPVPFDFYMDERFVARCEEVNREYLMMVAGLSRRCHGEAER
jgi:hypothetical protein